MLLNAANRLREHQGIIFLIVGDGKERANLKLGASARSAECGFTGTVSKAEVAEVMLHPMPVWPS